MDRKENIGVFLDRDGTVCEEVGYLRSPGEIRLIPGAAEAIRLLNERGIKAVVVTNQSGIARGFFTEERLKEIHRELSHQLAGKGAFLDGIYYCPHHPSEGDGPHRRPCDCRKPESGLILRAASDLGIALGLSYCVGDRLSDLECGWRVGTKGVLVLTGYGQEELASKPEEGAKGILSIASGLPEAIHWILRDLKSA